MNQEEQNQNLTVTKQIIPEETSKRITALRFLLAMLVVFIHNNLNADDAINYYHLAFNEPMVITWIKGFVCNTLGGAAVPLFFMFAGYLQFSKDDSYPNLIKKKARSLLLPYVIWTILCIFAFYLGQSIPKLAGFFQNEGNIVRNWDLKDWLGLFWVHGKNKHPLMYQLWFVRNLIVLVIFSPILKFCVKQMRCFLIFVIIFLFLKGLPLGFSTALFYFMAGAFLANYKIDFMKLTDKINWLEILVLMLCNSILEIKSIRSFGLGTIVSCLFFLKLSVILIKKDSVYSVLKYLAGFSFFLYAIHAPFLVNFLNKLSFRVIPLHGIGCLVQFIVPPALTILIGTSIGIALKKICPALFSVLNGGRR